MSPSARRLALEQLIKRDGFVVGRHFLFADVIDRPRVEEFIRDRLRRLEAPTWNELAQKIGRLGLWEFEDYRPAT
jgi:hypothetical protein